MAGQDGAGLLRGAAGDVAAAIASLPGLPFAEESKIVGSTVVQQAARGGIGVALGIWSLIDGDIASGSLMRPFALVLQPKRAFFPLRRGGTKAAPEVE